MATLEFVVKDENGKSFPAKAIIPDRRMNTGTKNVKRRDILGEVNAKWLSGRGHGKSDATSDKFQTHLRHFSVNMKKYFGTTNLAGVTQENVNKFVERIKTQPSELWKGRTPKALKPKAQSQVLKDVRKILALVNKEHMLRKTYGAMGIAVSHKNNEQPMKFALDRADLRLDLQCRIENCRTKWYGPVAQMGAAFGTRNAERIGSRDTLYKKDGKFYASCKLSRHEEVSLNTLKQRYGATFEKRLADVKEGMQYLIVQCAKNARNRVQPINTPERVAAVARLHDYIKSHPGHSQHMSPHPDKVNPENAKESYTKLMGRYGADKNSQLNAYSDRHWEAQRLWKECLDAGMTKRAASLIVIKELGHDSRDKIRYYVDTRKY